MVKVSQSIEGTVGDGTVPRSQQEPEEPDPQTVIYTLISSFRWLGLVGPAGGGPQRPHSASGTVRGQSDPHISV